MLLGLRHAVLNGVGDALKAAVAPQPRSARKIGAYWRANAVGAVTPGAGPSGNLSVKDLLAERDLLSRCTGRQWKVVEGPRRRMNPFRRKGIGRSFGLRR